MNETNNKFVRILLWIIAVLLILPLVIPIPPPEGVLPVEQLADPDSLFILIDDILFHYKTGGSGEPAMILLHGFGASLYSWREVTPVLSEDYTVYAYDRLAFGLTERPATWTGENPYTPQASLSQLDQMLDAWGLDQVVLVGNSAGGRVAMEYTLLHPERVLALILVSPALGTGQSPVTKFSALMKLPQARRIGPLLVRSIADSGLETLATAWHNPQNQPEDTIPLYTKPLQAENWDIALWHFSTSMVESQLPNQLDQFNLPILLLTGDDDRIVPTEGTIALKDQIPGAELVVLPECGHVPQEECPVLFLEAVEEFVANLSN
ncbi:MAG: alpha/beta hydrolase [Anaerolineales bacterium]|nr:alpha/beta hydrolase [Anaerolineales bacterium]